MKRLLLLALVVVFAGCTDFKVGDCVVDVSKHDPGGVGTIMKKGEPMYERPVVKFKSGKSYTVHSINLLTCKEYGL